MAEQQAGQELALRFEYRFDRLLPAKPAQVYQLPAPEQRWPIGQSHPQEKIHEQSCRHLS